MGLIATGVVALQQSSLRHVCARHRDRASAIREGVKTTTAGRSKYKECRICNFISTYIATCHSLVILNRVLIVHSGPRAQEASKPFLPDRPADACLFSAAETQAEQRVKAHRQRKINLSSGNRADTNRKKTPNVPLGNHHTCDIYRRAYGVGYQH